MNCQHMLSVSNFNNQEPYRVLEIIFKNTLQKVVFFYIVAIDPSPHSTRHLITDFLLPTCTQERVAEYCGCYRCSPSDFSSTSNLFCSPGSYMPRDMCTASVKICCVSLHVPFCFNFTLQCEISLLCNIQLLILSTEMI